MPRSITRQDIRQAGRSLGFFAELIESPLTPWQLEALRPAHQADGAGRAAADGEVVLAGGAGVLVGVPQARIRWC